jgi:cyanophycin synthetase
MPPPRHLKHSKKIGYFDGLRQPCIEFSFSVIVPKSINFEQLDEWLSKAFAVKVSEESRLNFKSHNLDEQKVVKVIWRIMHLLCILHEAIRIPHFEVGKIISLTQENSHSESWRVTIALPFVHFATQMTKNFALKTVYKILLWMIKNSYNDANRDYLFNFLNDSFVKKFHLHQFGGESTISILKQFWEKNIHFRHLGHGVYRIGFGAQSILIDRGAIHFDSAIGAIISNDKWRSANLLRDAGLPAPTHCRVSSSESLESMIQKLNWPLVVKPLDRDRGEGVTVNISNIQMLQDAVMFALTLSKTALIEKQVAGVCHRIFVAGGKICLVVKRLPKSVKGDGMSTIKDLVNKANAEENRKPIWGRLKPFPLDDLALSTLAKNNLHPDTILTEGVLAALRPIQSSAWGGVSEDCFDQIHPANLAIAIKAANLFNLSNAGIDIISEDITRPWYENGAIINEVNFSPLIADRTQQNIISHLLNEWLPNGGKIPIEVFVGGNAALNKARAVQSNYTKKGVQCWLTNHLTSLSPSGEMCPLAAHNLFSKVSALLFDKSVEALLIVIQNDELLETGLPVPYIDCIHDVTKKSNQVNKSKVNQDDISWQKQIMNLLKAHSKESLNYLN